LAAVLCLIAISCGTGAQSVDAGARGQTPPASARCTGARQVSIEHPIRSVEDMAANADVIAIIKVEDRFERPQAKPVQQAPDGEARLVEKHASVRIERSSAPHTLVPGERIDLYLALSEQASRSAEDVTLVGDELDALYQAGVTAVVGLTKTKTGYSNGAGAVVDTGRGLAPTGHPECYGGEPSRVGEQVKGETADSLFDRLVKLGEVQPG
jgi:hypothetical protein